ncbi:MAG TPA: hypothetical protein VG323_16665 [Thermoanaerobaculia bacterium]|nr:hypothetical protein [Thermoanaerobaculia bacterium]
MKVDFALRALILVAGTLAAVVLALKGHGAALPALAAGGILGACATHFATTPTE